MVVKTTNLEAVAAATSVAAQRWPHLLNEMISTIVDPSLARPETRFHRRNAFYRLGAAGEPWFRYAGIVRYPVLP
jgi:hypothetical protein